MIEDTNCFNAGNLEFICFDHVLLIDAIYIFWMSVDGETEMTLLLLLFAVLCCGFLIKLFECFLMRKTSK